MSHCSFRKLHTDSACQGTLIGRSGRFDNWGPATQRCMGSFRLDSSMSKRLSPLYLIKNIVVPTVLLIAVYAAALE